MKQFQKVKVNSPERAIHDLSKGSLLNIKMGDLVPVLLQETLPGDNFHISMEAYLKLLPLISPIMHRVNVDVHFFYVPNRILCDPGEWEIFLTGGKNGNEVVSIPKITADELIDVHASTLLKKGSLADYFGLPVDRISAMADGFPLPSFSQLPFRAYQKIYEEYYMDKNLKDMPKIPSNMADIDWDPSNLTDITTLLSIRKRCWEKDYFTTALPTAQRGPSVTLPLGTSASVTGQPTVLNSATGNLVGSSVGLNTLNGVLSNDGLNTPLKFGGLTVDLSNATAATINQFRQAISLQRWYEKSMRGGSRYREHILSFFGTKVKDASIQIPQYIGGGRLPIQIGEVLQTSSTDETSPQGNQTGQGHSSGMFNPFSFYSDEHGYIIGIMSVMPRTAYFQGIQRHWTRDTKLDFFYPEFAHLGEQEVKSKELFVDGVHDEETFGYQERFAEYRYNFDTIHGDFRDDLLFWHLGRKFNGRPVLNETFTEANPDDRIFAIENDRAILVQTYCDIKAIRPVPKYGTPL